MGGSTPLVLKKCSVGGQRRTHGEVGGQNSPIENLKKYIPFFLKRYASFHTEFTEIAVMLFCAH